MDRFIQLLNAVGKRVYELDALKIVKKKNTHTHINMVVYTRSYHLLRYEENDSKMNVD